MSKKDIAFAATCMVLSLIFIFWLIPANTPSSSLVGDVQPSLIPNAMMIFIFCAGAVILLQAWQAAKLKPASADDTAVEAPGFNYKRLLMVFVGLLAYLFTVKYIGFYVTTCLSMLACLRLLNKNMTWLKAALCTVVFLVLIFLLFEKGLYVRLPRGILL